MLGGAGVPLKGGWQEFARPILVSSCLREPESLLAVAPSWPRNDVRRSEELRLTGRGFDLRRQVRRVSGQPQLGGSEDRYQGAGTDMAPQC